MPHSPPIWPSDTQQYFFTWTYRTAISPVCQQICGNDFWLPPVNRSLRDRWVLVWLSKNWGPGYGCQNYYHRMKFWRAIWQVSWHPAFLLRFQSEHLLQCQDNILFQQHMGGKLWCFSNAAGWHSSDVISALLHGRDSVWLRASAWMSDGYRQQKLTFIRTFK